MDPHEQLIDNLWEHCFGEGDPTSMLLNHVKFPKNWVSRYLSFVEKVDRLWGDADTWPVRVVTAVHFASFYLDIRYEAWKQTGSRNERTEKLLRQIRVPSEVFLLKPYVNWSESRVDRAQEARSTDADKQHR